MREGGGRQDGRVAAVPDQAARAPRAVRPGRAGRNAQRRARVRWPRGRRRRRRGAGRRPHSGVALRDAPVARALRRAGGGGPLGGRQAAAVDRVEHRGVAQGSAQAVRVRARRGRDMGAPRTVRPARARGAAGRLRAVDGRAGGAARAGLVAALAAQGLADHHGRARSNGADVGQGEARVRLPVAGRGDGEGPQPESAMGLSAVCLTKHLFKKRITTGLWPKAKVHADLPLHLSGPLAPHVRAHRLRTLDALVAHAEDQRVLGGHAPPLLQQYLEHAHSIADAGMVQVVLGYAGAVLKRPHEPIDLALGDEPPQRTILPLYLHLAVQHLRRAQVTKYDRRGQVIVRPHVPRRGERAHEARPIALHQRVVRVPHLVRAPLLEYVLQARRHIRRLDRVGHEGLRVERVAERVVAILEGLELAVPHRRSDDGESPSPLWQPTPHELKHLELSVGGRHLGVPGRHRAPPFAQHAQDINVALLRRQTHERFLQARLLGKVDEFARGVTSLVIRERDIFVEERLQATGRAVCDRELDCAREDRIIVQLQKVERCELIVLRRHAGDGRVHGVPKGHQVAKYVNVPHAGCAHGPFHVQLPDPLVCELHDAHIPSHAGAHRDR